MSERTSNALADRLAPYLTGEINDRLREWAAEAESWCEDREEANLSAVFYKLQCIVADAVKTERATLANRIFARIAHGDEKHQEWLKAELDRVCGEHR